MVNALYEEGLTILRDAGVEDASFDCGVLFDDTGGGTDFLPLVRRRAAGEPLQYLAARWEFYGLSMKMRPGVLIARPDTEILCERAIDFLKKRPDAVFLELGSGSGALSIAVAKMSGAGGVCMDISPEALKLTRENADGNGVALDIRKGDIFGFEKGLERESFDAVLSNPPYLTAAELSSLQRELEFEPRTALDGGADGLDFYRYIPSAYAQALKPGGALMLETGNTQAEAVAAICENAGYDKIKIYKDFGGRDRVVVGLKGEHR